MPACFRRVPKAVRGTVMAPTASSHQPLAHGAADETSPRDPLLEVPRLPERPSRGPGLMAAARTKRTRAQQQPMVLSPTRAVSFLSDHPGSGG